MIVVIFAAVLFAAVQFQTPPPAPPITEARRAELAQCFRDAVELYGDLGAESSVGYEEMSGSDAHFEGIVWGMDYAQGCLDEN